MYENLLAMNFALILFALCSLTTVHCCDYAQFGNDHTMCRFRGDACKIERKGVDQQGIKQLVDAHNRMRQKVANGKQPGQPGAANMKQLRWNNELAVVAQRLADQCKMQHDSNRRIKKYSWVGQNIYIGWSSSTDSTPNYDDAVTAWYDEVTKPGFNAKDISPYVFGGGTGHYTQVVWATTEEVGCGFSFYKDTNGMYAKLVVCNYGPGGNMMGGDMYKIGAPCSQCKGGCSKEFPGLCTN